MKRLFKLLFVFVAVVAIAFAAKIMVGATSYTVTIVPGASIRTAEDAYQGIRFQASVNTLENATEHGFYVAIGSHDEVDMMDAIEESKSTVGGNKLVKIAIDNESENLTFKGVVYGISNTNYVTDITAIAYVYNGTSYTFSEAVVRNIGEVALKAKANGTNGTFVDGIITYLNTNYKKVYVNTTLKTIAIDGVQYETDPTKLGALFLQDWNAKFGTSITGFVNSSSDKFYKSAIEGVSDNKVVLTSGKLYEFFHDPTYGPKWDWLIDLVIAYAGTPANNNWKYTQALALKDLTTGEYAQYIPNENAYYKGAHFCASLIGFFLRTNGDVGWAGIGFATSTNPRLAFANVANYNDTILADGEGIEFIENDATYQIPTSLPMFTKQYYTYYRLSDGTNKITESTIDLSAKPAPLSLSLEWNPINYTITYKNGDNTINTLNPTSYNIETATINLPNYALDGYAFGGWYDNAELSGEPVTTIDLGSHGDKTFYVKMTAGIPVTLTLDYCDTRTAISQIYNEFVSDTLSYHAKSSYTTSFYSSITCSSTERDAIFKPAWQNQAYREKWGWLFELVSDAHVENGEDHYKDRFSKIWTGTWDDSPASIIVQEIKGLGYNTQAGVFSSSYYMYDWSTDTYNYKSAILAASKTANGNANLVSGVTISEYVNNPTRFGYVFDGWYDNSEYNGSAITEVPNIDTTLYAKWVDVCSNAFGCGIVNAYNDTDGNEISLFSSTYVGNNGKICAWWYKFALKYNNETQAYDVVEYISSGEGLYFNTFTQEYDYIIALHSDATSYAFFKYLLDNSSNYNYSFKFADTILATDNTSNQKGVNVTFYAIATAK